MVFSRSADLPSKKNSADKEPAELQTEEFLADVLGLNLAAVERNRGETSSVYGAMIGAICALLAEGDIKGHWFLGELDSHPSTSDRITLLLSLMPKLFSDIEPLKVGDSVQDLNRNLAAFATACLQSSLNDHDADVYPPATWKGVDVAYNEACLAIQVRKNQLPDLNLSTAWEVFGAN